MSIEQDDQRPSCEEVSNLRDRVDRSLRKLGYPEARVVDAANEIVTLTCPASDRNDQCVMSVAIRLLPGVSVVKFAPEAQTNQ